MTTARNIAITLAVFIVSAGIVPAFEDPYGVESSSITIVVYMGVMFGSVSLLLNLIARFLAASTEKKRGVVPVQRSRRGTAIAMGFQPDTSDRNSSDNNSIDRNSSDRIHRKQILLKSAAGLVQPPVVSSRRYTTRATATSEVRATHLVVPENGGNRPPSTNLDTEIGTDTSPAAAAAGTSPAPGQRYKSTDSQIEITNPCRQAVNENEFGSDAAEVV